MTLAAGTRLGPYEIQSAIGAGGMGEVYKARDTRLERVVAIKVLPERLSSSPVSRARFEKEARAVAALSHPNICTIHDVGSAGELHYLVMEYLDGETLEAILARGALPLAETVRHGREIAAALAAAHRHGIVHGDLKPGNVMITPGGARLLDFGLARRMAIAGISSAEASEASTVEGALTNDGTIRMATGVTPLRRLTTTAAGFDV